MRWYVAMISLGLSITTVVYATDILPLHQYVAFVIYLGIAATTIAGGINEWSRR